MTDIYSAILQKIEIEMENALPNIGIDGLVEPCRDLLLRGGKRWRPLLLVLAGNQSASAYKLTPLVEFAHTASLIHDDIEDSSDMRRGASAAHIVWGIDTALNAASWLYFQAASCIRNAELSVTLENRLYALYMEDIKNLHLGQAMDISWHKNNTVLPSTGEYMTMIRLKTGTLASLAVKTGLYTGGADEPTIERAGKIAADIGAAFQILDDVTNLTTGNPGKKRGDDIVEGKKSYPVLLHIEQNKSDFPLIAAYFEQAKREGADSSVVESCISLLNKSGVIAQAAAFARALVRTACDDFRNLFPGREVFTEPIVRLFEQMCAPESSAEARSAEGSPPEKK
jgi:octaprenyl-diphosphate synthase